jgi:hypothetical protein
MRTVTTWLEGRMQTVRADDPRVAEVEAQRRLWAHVHAMRSLAQPLRAGYLRDVEAAEGDGARVALERAFSQDWERRRGG